MKKVRLGRTELMVTPICFGTSGLADMPETYGYGVDAERAHATIRAIFDGPANFLDTSRIYGDGRSEERIGAVIRERGGLPEGFVISTKLDRDPRTNVFDAARARRSMELSLKALGLERIDLMNLHDPEHARSLHEATSRDGALGELFRLKEEGLVKAVGLAAGNVDVMTPLLRDWDFDALITHNRFTIANRNAEAMMELAMARGMAVINAAPYAGGILGQRVDGVFALCLSGGLRRRRWIRSAGSRRSARVTAFRPAPPRCNFRCVTPGSLRRFAG